MQRFVLERIATFILSGIKIDFAG